MLPGGGTNPDDLNNFNSLNQFLINSKTSIKDYTILVWEYFNNWYSTTTVQTVTPLDGAGSTNVVKPTLDIAVGSDSPITPNTPSTSGIPTVTLNSPVNAPLPDSPITPVNSNSNLPPLNLNSPINTPVNSTINSPVDISEFGTQTEVVNVSNQGTQTLLNGIDVSRNGLMCRILKDTLPKPSHDHLQNIINDAIKKITD